MTFALALAAVYMTNGLRVVWDEIPVDLPTAQSGEVLTVFRKDQQWIFKDQQARDTLLDGRTSDQYEFGGRTGCGLTSTEKELRDCKRSLEKARLFIWDHWQQRRPGYVIVKFASVDAESDAHIFVERGENDRMRLVWTWERVGVMFESPGAIHNTPDIYEVRFRRASRTNGDDWQFDKGTRYLELIDANGKRRTL